MDTKLTLKLDQAVIGKAKAYAKSRKTSLSSLIENYLQQLTAVPPSKKEITPLVKSLSGIISDSRDIDAKTAYADHLLKKYK